MPEKLFSLAKEFCPESLSLTRHFQNTYFMLAEVLLSRRHCISKLDVLHECRNTSVSIDVVEFFYDLPGSSAPYESLPE